jgi:hypothetical protein
MLPARRWESTAPGSAAGADIGVPAIVALPVGLPTVNELFAFMRDAERRFETLRMRIEERTFTTAGEHLVVVDTTLQHPGHAKILSSEPDRGTAGNYELWVTDGHMVQTYSARHRIGTQRPIRNRPRGLDDRGFPERSTVYVPVTALPAETLPDTFIHPAGYCQNVLSTGACSISGTDLVAGREAIVLECDHPRTIELAADRPDFHIEIAVDRIDGVITRLIETIAGDVTREALVVAYDPDAALPPGAFDFSFPSDANLLY